MTTHPIPLLPTESVETGPYPSNATILEMILIRDVIPYQINMAHEFGYTHHLALDMGADYTRSRIISYAVSGRDYQNIINIGGKYALAGTTSLSDLGFHKERLFYIRGA